MKKNLIKQAKKSLSLFLAVVMLMSCWVWVAPEKADAGTISATTYTVEIQWTISQRSCDGGDIQYKTLGNGWGSESSYKIALSSMADKKNEGTYEHTWTTDEFPSVVKITTKGGFVVSNPSRCVVNYLKINGKTVYDGSGGVAFNLPTWNANASASAEMYPNYTDTDSSGTSGNLGAGYNWPRPMIAGFTEGSASAPDINLTLNKVGGQNVSDTTTYDLSKYTFYDQYGKQIADGDKATFLNNNRFSGDITETTHVAGTPNSEETTEHASDIWVNPDNHDGVIVSPNLQVNNPKGSTGSAEFYLVRTYEVKDSWEGSQTSKVSAKINVTYHRYTVKFDAGLSSAVITAGGSTYTGTYSPSNYHGGSIDVPSKTEAEGYTFYEYWSKPQPATGDASYNALTANFAQPCTTEDYNAYKSASGSTVSGDIVTDADGNRWYDAGKKLDPAVAKTIDVSDNYANFEDEWHGWWLSKDLSVKFYDVDGTFLGEKVMKSGQTQSDITWPTSKYIDSGYTTGAFKFNVDANFWENIDGTEINKNSYTFTKDLILTPKLTEKSFTDKYKVSFINPNNGNSVGVGTEGGNYAYRQNIKDRADEAEGKIAATPSDVNGDIQYSYELLGWSSVEPTTGKNYHVLLEDADFDINGTSIGLNSDWVVRSEATYYAVYRRHTKTYVVDFNFKDATGADTSRRLKVKYGATLVPPTDYVPYSYVTKGFGYTFDTWTYAADNGDATLGYATTIPFTNEYVSIQGAALDGTADLDPITFTASYGDPVATPYTVTFNYVNDKGEEVTKNVEVRNEQFILQGTVDALKPAEKWEHEDNLYTYADKWEITEGAATVGVGGTEKKAGDFINTAELISLTPTSNLAFKAVYADPKPFYTVTYIDGLNTYSERVLVGSNVPAWLVKEGEIYTPADYEGEGGRYEFQGWYDEKQTDETYKSTNGNKITTADTVSGNLTLYSQYKFIPDTYLIRFMSYDGKTVLSSAEREKGESIEDIMEAAVEAAQTRPGDETYTYQFLGWDKEVPAFCEGYDVTFIAQYKPIYKYYDVKWYNSRLVDGEWVADTTKTVIDGKEVEPYLLATTHHTYNSKLYTPSVDSLTCLEAAPSGQNYVFAGWYYNDKDGNAVKYERGMLITEEMEFYATFTLTEKVYTVTTVVKGKETAYSVASGKTASIPDPQAGYVDETYHDAFVGWYTDAAYAEGSEFDLETEVITADTELYAKFEQSEHSFTNKSLKTAPTYYATGVNEAWCFCDTTKTKEETIPKLTDTVVPTGTIYLGSKSWSSEGAPAYETDNDPISIFVNEDTDVIITSNDTGDVHDLYNPSGIGIGVKFIRAFAFPAETVLTADNYGAAQELAIDVYSDDTENLTNNANFAVKLGDFIVADLDENGGVQYIADENGAYVYDEEKDTYTKAEDGNGDYSIKHKELTSGEAYIIYYYVVDKAGKQLNTKVRTAKFIYDNTDPLFEVEGSSNDSAVPTFCGKATVTGIEKDTVLKVNNTVVEVKYAEDATTGTYEIAYAEGVDNILITATDKAGNTYSKKIKVAEHSYLLTEQESSCGVAGFKKEECIICGYLKTDETYPVLDHVWGQPEVIPADCANNGIIVVTCENCGEDIETEFEEDGVTPAVPALGHVFAKDDNDEIIYATVTESTCKTPGLAEAYCTDCKGELEGGYITKELALNPENHEDVTVTEVPADCIHNGYYTEACSCGAIIEHKDHETDPEIYKAKGHGETEWEVIKEATCHEPGTMVEKCTVCTDIITAETAYGYTENADGNFAYVTDEDGNKVTEDDLYMYYLIPATGEHVLVIKDRENDVKEPAVGVEGFIKWSCSAEGCTYTKTDEYKALVGVNVTFKAEDGTVIKEYKNIPSGTMIAKDGVTAPEKTATEKETYTFAGWKDAAGNTVKLPLTATENLVLTATYRATKILYTHIFKVPTTWTGALAEDEGTTGVYATLVGAYGDERVPSGIPVFKLADAEADAELKKMYTFEFKGWKNASGVLVKDFTVVGDAEFTAYFEAIPVKYEVVFYNGGQVIHTAMVDAGEVAVYNKYDDQGTEATEDDVLIVPEKAYDDEYHYAYSGKWYTDAACTNEYEGEAITEKTRLYAGFTATAHSYTVNTKVGTVVPESDPEIKDGIIQKADCLLPEITEMICSCGHIKTEQTADALGHDQYKRDENGEYVLVDGEKVENIETVTTEDGVFKVLKCSRCGEEISKDEVSVTVTFKHENGSKDYVVKLDVGADIEYDVKPEKEATAAFTYTFLGWYLEGDATQTVVTSFGKADADKTFVAKYTATARKYTVSYLDETGERILAKHEIVYGGKVPAAPAAPEKTATENDHFTFIGWSVAAGSEVTGDIAIQPRYKTEAHDFQKTGETTGATCTEGGGDVYACTCGKTMASGGSPAIGHKFNKVIDEKPATYEEAGYVIKECANGCGETQTTTIPKREYKNITVTVKNAEGKVVEGAKVDLYRDGVWVDANKTNKDGVVTFKVGDEDYTYTVLISGVEGLENQEIEVGAGENKEINVEKPEVTCSCSCHRPGFWGMVFRFFHKIISWFTGRISCCSCPDSKY